jgi:hypothetical protein
MFFDKITTAEYQKGKYEPIDFIDVCFEAVKDFVGQSSSLLNDSRILFRSLNKKEALGKFYLFKELCLSFLDALDEVKDMVKHTDQSRKLNKLLRTMQEIVNEATQRKIKSKIPLKESNYLKTSDVAEFDIDWMLRRIENFWVKFLQVYGSLRIDLILSSNT